MITLQELGKDYGTKTALQNLSLTIKEGEIFGFLGHNGAGNQLPSKVWSVLLNQLVVKF